MQVLSNPMLSFPLHRIATFLSGSRYAYDYESHVQLKQEAFIKSKSRHLSFKTDAKLAVTYLWHGSEKNETILKLEVCMRPLAQFLRLR